MTDYDFLYRGAGAAIFEPVVILKPEKITLMDGARVDAFTKLEGGQGIYIGRGVHLASFCHIGIGGGQVVLDDYSAFASGAKVLSGSAQIDALSMSASAPPDMQITKRTLTTIGKYACLLTNAVVLPGITVGEGAVVGAGAVATRSIPAWEIWAGVPARKIGERPRPKDVPDARHAQPLR